MIQAGFESNEGWAQQSLTQGQLCICTEPLNGSSRRGSPTSGGHSNGFHASQPDLSIRESSKKMLRTGGSVGKLNNRQNSMPPEREVLQVNSQKLVLCETSGHDAANTNKLAPLRDKSAKAARQAPQRRNINTALTSPNNKIGLTNGDQQAAFVSMPAEFPSEVHFKSLVKAKRVQEAPSSAVKTTSPPE